MAMIALISIALIIFLASRSYSYSQDVTFVNTREPARFVNLEAMHAELIQKIDSFADTAERESFVPSDDKRKEVQELAIRVTRTVEDLREVKKTITIQLAKERELMVEEIRKLRDERDAAIRESVERFAIIRLSGEAAFRIGAILVSIYFISILSNIAKYWFRVADHLNAVADSIDTLAAAGMNLEKGIAALTPHPIDFQAEEPMSLKTIKDLMGFAAKRSKE